MKLQGSLDNYIEMHRERAGLSHAELSYLLSFDHRADVTRYQQSLRAPNLETLLALEMVFGEPIQVVFAGVAEKVRAQLTWRAERLLESLSDEPTPEWSAKVDCLSRLAHPDDQRIVPTCE